jgi:hypothetical protein
MSFAPRFWVFIVATAVVIGCIVGHFFGVWWALGVFASILIFTPVALIIIAYSMWMASGSH